MVPLGRHPLRRRPVVETITYSQFTHAHLDAKRIPFNGVFELTFRCNLHCGFCYCRAQRPGHAAELDWEGICRIIDEIADAGCLQLQLTGGEPLLRRDFAEIYRYVRRKGIVVTLFTNGTCIQEKVADLLASYPPKKVEITMYGATPQTYEKVTRTEGSFAACMRGLDILLDRCIKVVLKSTISIDNHHELPELKRFAEERHLDYRYDAMLDPCIDGTTTPCSYRLSPRQIVDLDLQDDRRMTELRKLCQLGRRPADELLVYACGAGEGNFHVDPYGKLSMCGLTRYAAYDLTQGSFLDGFYRHFPALRSQRFTLSEVSPCGSCRLIGFCTNCPGTAFLENGRVHQPSEFHCQVAQLRAQEAAC